jgi:hypothetical protein
MRAITRKKETQYFHHLFCNLFEFQLLMHQRIEIFSVFVMHSLFESKEKKLFFSYSKTALNLFT